VSHFYRAYGLILRSQTPIQGLSPLPPEDEPSLNEDQVSVFIGEPQAWVNAALRLAAQPIYVTARWDGVGDPALEVAELGDGESFRFSYLDGTRFVVDAAMRKIWGNCPASLTQEDLATYLVGPVLGFVLRRRGVLALHASTFCSNGLAFVLCGEGGAGKSTTAAAMALRGVPIQCEDITAVRERTGGLWVAPGYPRVNLWPESVANVFSTPKTLPKITPNWEKQFLSLDGKLAEFEKQERQLAAVYLLAPRRQEDSAPRIEEISSREATLLIVQNTYMNYLLDGKQREAEFDAIARLVSRVIVRRLIPHSDPAKLPSLCDLLQADSAKIAGTFSSTLASDRA
jgi:hypothetical protein